MCELCREGVVSRGSTFRLLKELVHEIVERFSVSLILLFGSYARGDICETSDVDLIVVGEFQERFHERTGKVLELSHLDRDLEVLVYTTEEFERMRAQRRPFIEHVMSEGRVLYEG